MNTVPNLKKSLGKMRHGMPQIADFKAFEKDLDGDGVGVSIGEEKTTSLKPTQTNFNWDKVDSIGKGELKPIYISKDNYILDGHHRWLACHKHQGGKMPVKRVDLDIKDALKFVEGKPYVEKKTINESSNGFNRSMRLAEKARLRGDHKRAAYHLQNARNHMNQGIVNEEAPPGMENWIKQNKSKFQFHYGSQKGIEVLYAKAWKMHKNTVGDQNPDDLTEGAAGTENFNRPFLKKELAHHEAQIAHHRAGATTSWDELGKSVKKIKDIKQPPGSKGQNKPESWMEKAGRDLDATQHLSLNTAHSEKLAHHVELRDRIRKVLGMKPNAIKEALQQKLVSALNEESVSLSECDFEAPETANAGHRAQVKTAAERSIEAGKNHAPVSQASVENKTYGKYGSYISRMQLRALEGDD